LNYFL